jgi:PAS domain S-box-containing protein
VTGWTSRLGLRWRFLLLNALLLLSMWAVLVVFTLAQVSAAFRHELGERAEGLAAFVASSATDPLANLDVRALRTLLGELRERDDVVDAFVFDDDMRILTDGTVANPNRQALVADGVRNAILTGSARATRVGGGLVSVTRPIRFGERLLGGLHIDLSLARLEQERSRYVTRSLVVSLAVLLLGAALSAVAVNEVVRPLARLTAATRTVAEGDFQGEVKVEAGGEIGSLAGSFNEMTRRLRETTVSRDSIDAVMRSMDEGLMVLDDSGVVRAANPAALALLGLADEDAALGLNARRLLGSSEEEAAVWLSAARYGAETSLVESVLRRDDGSTIPVEISLAPVLRGDSPRGFVWVARDIRARLAAQRSLEASEERYRRLVELSLDAIVVVRDGVVVFVNPAGERLLGGEPAAPVVGRPLGYFLAAEERHASLGMVSGVLRTGIGMTAHEEAWLDATGRGFDAEVVITGLEFDGQPAVQLVVRDVSERSSIERMKTEFVSTVSHELRTPLTSILGSLGLLLGGVAGAIPGEARRMLELAERNGRRLLRLVNDLLDLDRLGAGRMSFHREATELAPLVEHAVAAHRDYGRTCGVELRCEGELGGALVDVDGERFQQVLANLLSNAVKYAPEGSEVRISLERVEGELEVAVSDSGPGIPDEFQPKLFERFVQADGSDTRRAGGTGLGLAISKGIIERLGGRIGFTSETGVGTTFWVRLPEYVVRGEHS